MSDLRSLMHEAAGPAAATDVSVADADLVRARRGLRRRQIGRLGAGSGLVAVAALGALAIVAPSVLPGSSSTPSVASSGGSTVTVTGTKLVSYSGKQPVGFTLDKVPAGWEVRDSDAGVLTLAPKGAPKDKPKDGVSFEGKIAVMAQNDTGVPTGIQLDKVQVGNQPGVIAHMKGAGDTRTLFVKQPNGVYLEIQVWDGLGWGNPQIAEFGASVHITDDVQLSVG